MIRIDEQTIAERGRWVAEFASEASLADLHQARSSGQELIDELLAERRSIFEQIHKAIALRNSLATTIHHESTDFTAKADADRRRPDG